MREILNEFVKVVLITESLNEISDVKIVDDDIYFDAETEYVVDFNLIGIIAGKEFTASFHMYAMGSPVYKNTELLALDLSDHMIRLTIEGATVGIHSFVAEEICEHVRKNHMIFIDMLEEVNELARRINRSIGTDEYSALDNYES